MKRLYILLLLFVVALAPPRLSASLQDYGFSYNYGSQISPSAMNQVWAGSQGSYIYGSTSNSLSIGFDFVFDGSTYDQFSISTSGVIGLGSSVPSSTWNYLQGGYGYPVIAPFWDEHRVSGTRGGYITPTVTYGVTGEAPNRVCVIEWEEVELMAWYWIGGQDYNQGTWQVRLYEGTNKIEFWYGEMNICGYYCLNTSATIGIANSYGEVMSVTPYGSWASLDRWWSNDYVDLYYNSMDEGMVYTFQPCQVNTYVDPNVGGSTETTLLAGAEVMSWSSESFYPFRIENYTSDCYNGRYYRIEIGGQYASEYTVDQTEGWLEFGSSTSPQITFTPLGVGVRPATITITDDNYFSRTYQLAGIGMPRIQWIPDMNTYDGGGTAGLASGDTLMNGILVPRPSTRDFHPIRLYNASTNYEAPPASIRVRIDSLDDISQQFVLQTESTFDLGAQDSYTPIIRFLTLNVGPQEARITIFADGGERQFLMRPISSAPGIEFWSGVTKVDMSNPLFQWTNTCAGEVATSVPIEIRSTGTEALVVSDISFWLTDTVYGDNIPPYPLIRDMYQAAEESRDYAFSDIPGVAPIPANNPVRLPFTLQPGQKRTIYATFVAQEPGKRFARAFFRTNAQNYYGTDTTLGAQPGGVMGLATIDLVGRGIGSMLAGSLEGLPLQPVIFPATRVGETAEMVAAVANGGYCDLRINRNDLKIFSGDVNEFKLLSAFPSSTTDANGNWVIPAGSVDSIRFSFKPTRSGTRIARLRIHTNDSTVYLPGISERGTYYLDLHGFGRTGLDGHDLVLDPVVIGSSSIGAAEFESTVNAPVEIQSILFMGGDADQFSEDASAPWPALPHTVLPGSKLRLGIRMTPVGEPGIRRTTLYVVSTTGDTAVVNIRGEAGTRALVVSPNSLFDNVSLGVGQTRRQTVMISNNGTMPLRITSVKITGTDSANYRIGRFPRLDLAAGATEYLEITFAPTGTGQSSAQLEIVADGVTYTVQLGGESMMARDGDPDVDIPTTPAGVTGETAITGLTVHPNPAVTEVVLNYRLTATAVVTIEVFNAAGSLVDRIPVGSRSAGSCESRIDVSRLASGTYRFAIRSGDRSVRGSFTVTR